MGPQVDTEVKRKSLPGGSRRSKEDSNTDSNTGEEDPVSGFSCGPVPCRIQKETKRGTWPRRQDEQYASVLNA